MYYIARMSNRIYFSSFKESGSIADTVSIARISARGFTGPKLKELAPTMAMIKRFRENPAGQWQWFVGNYIEDLYAREDLEELYERCVGKVLLCHCAHGLLCHRILLAKTFEIEFGADCREVGGWDIPFNKAFEKIESFIGLWYENPFDDGPINLVGNYKRLKGHELVPTAPPPGV